MKLARFWSRGDGDIVDPSGERIRVTARGWSDESVEAARSRAREVARRVAERLARNPGDKKAYLYGDRPLPEPILREFRDGSGTVFAAVTRNVYGAQILNTDRMMFIDIDREDPAPRTPAHEAGGLDSALGGLFKSLFGSSVESRPPVPASGAPYGVVQEVTRVADRRGLAVRVYKTAAGYRGLVTNSRFDAANDATEALLREFGADPTYMHLCRVQESFRARLTPKPWRCDHHKPPVQFPFETPQAESQFRRWETEYLSRTAQFATCQYVAAVGTGSVDDEFRPLIDLHDEITKAHSGLPLA